MRAGPLSNDRVIRLLNDHFVAVYVSNEDYEGKGPAPPEERAERNRIWREAAAARLSSGTVHAYVLSPDGRVVDSLHVAEAARVERTQEMLERAVERFPSRKESLPRTALKRLAVPETPEGGLVLHLVARYLRREGDRLLTLAEHAGLGETRNASWQAFPAENWIAFDRTAVTSLLPSRTLREGDSWMPDRATLARLLVYFYPSTECNDPGRNRIDEQNVTATVLSVKDGVTRARLRGRIRMKHNFYPAREDQNFTDAAIEGYLDFEPATSQIRKLRLVTDGAVYAGLPFGVAVQSVAPLPRRADDSQRLRHRNWGGGP